MPLEISDFPSEVQVAFFIFSYLEDRFEGMSGQYMGKSWNNLQYLFELFDVEDKAERKRKAEERKSASGGKQYTHNVKG